MFAENAKKGKLRRRIYGASQLNREYAELKQRLRELIPRVQCASRVHEVGFGILAPEGDERCFSVKNHSA